jgi:hypothetical protein
MLGGLSPPESITKNIICLFSFLSDSSTKQSQQSATTSKSLELVAGTRNLSHYMNAKTLENVHRIKVQAHKRYGKRLNSVKSFCKSKQYQIPKVERNNAVNMTKRWRREMWWDIRNGFAWCCVYKVASSSLVTHMINIAGWDWDKYLQHLTDTGIARKRWRDYMIEELYPLPG